MQTLKCDVLFAYTFVCIDFAVLQRWCILRNLSSCKSCRGDHQRVMPTPINDNTILLLDILLDILTYNQLHAYLFCPRLPLAFEDFGSRLPSPPPTLQLSSIHAHLLPNGGGTLQLLLDPSLPRAAHQHLLSSLCLFLLARYIQSLRSQVLPSSALKCLRGF